MIPEPVHAGSVELSSWAPSEAGTYVALRDELVFRFTTEDADLDVETARRRIEHAGSDPSSVSFAIRVDRRPVGTVLAIRLGSSVEISYWLTPTARGSGIATTALETATRWAFEAWDPELVRLEIDPDNDASIRLAERCGYRRAGMRLESRCGGPAYLFDRRRPDGHL